MSIPEPVQEEFQKNLDNYAKELAEKFAEHVKEYDKKKPKKFSKLTLHKFYQEES